MALQEHILVIRLSSLGDVLLTTPVIRGLRAMFPAARITMLVRAAYADAYRYNPCIDELLEYPASPDAAKALRGKLLATRFTRVLDLQNNLRTRLLLRGITAPVYRFVKHGSAKFLLVKLKIDILSRHGTIPIRYASAFPGLSLDAAGLEVWLPPDYSLPVPMPDNAVVLCPGSRHKTKQWLPAYFVQLAVMLQAKGLTPVIMGGKGDSLVVAEVAAAVPGATALQTNDDLFLTMAMLKRAKLAVCNDSGLMHAASAAGVPLLAVFGSTTRAFGFAPYNARHLVLENNSLTCRPCSHIGKNSCPRGHFNCMKGLTPQMAYALAVTLLGETA